MANEAESGLELVLDNRKLILVFGVLIAICGCAFVLGFIEGKRQGFQEESQMAGESATKATPETNLAQDAKPTQENEEAAPTKADPADQTLDWYQNINRRGGALEPVSPAAVTPKETVAASSTPDSVPAATPKPETAAEPPVTYSIQVGAFKQKHQLDVRAQMLREKGFDVWTVAPQVPGDFYFLRVGKFRSRAEAVATQSRLKKNGISSFIKTN